MVRCCSLYEEDFDRSPSANPEAQNAQICAAAISISVFPLAVHNGGYFAAREALYNVQPSPALTARTRAESHGP
jgi:hypothetical protein